MLDGDDVSNILSKNLCIINIDIVMFLVVLELVM